MDEKQLEQARTRGFIARMNHKQRNIQVETHPQLHEAWLQGWDEAEREYKSYSGSR